MVEPMESTSDMSVVEAMEIFARNGRQFQCGISRDNEHRIATIAALGPVLGMFENVDRKHAKDPHSFELNLLSMLKAVIGER